jgi:spore coat protein U-like protein
MTAGATVIRAPAVRAGRGRPRRVGAAAALLGGLLAAGAAPAVDCSVSTTGVAFGVYDPGIATPTDAVGDLTVTCIYVEGHGTRVSYTAMLTAGSSGNYARRQLRAGTATLDYNLFDSATRTVVWGNGTAGTSMVAGSVTVGPGVGNNIRQDSYPIYGRIPAQQSSSLGDYADTIIVTLTF